MKSIINIIINGIFDVVKLCIIIYAVFYAFNSGLAEHIVNMIKF